MQRAQGRKRDFLDWLGVVVNVVQIFMYTAALIVALYWYVLRPGGLAAVVVAIAVCVVALVGCVAYLLYLYRKK